MSVINGLPPVLTAVEASRLTAEFTLRLTPFDQRHYRKLTAARAETIRRVVGKLKPALRLERAVDAGCGVGFFSQTLEKCGLSVCGFDGREENIAEARKRLPHLPFETANIEEPQHSGVGAVRLCAVLRIDLSPGKSAAGDAEFEGFDGEMFVAGEHVPAGREAVHAVARRATVRRPELDGCCVLSQRKHPREDALPSGLCGGVSRHAAAGA